MFLSNLKKWTPNSLTIIRLVLAFAYPFIDKELRLPILIFALLTEFLDGFLARIWNVTSHIGALLDPIADKCFIFAVAIVLFTETDLSWWNFLLVGFRDIVVFLGASSLLLQRNWKPFLNVRPTISGKITTVLQFILLLSAIFLGRFNSWILYSTIVSSIIAGVGYLYLLKVNNFYRDY